MALTEDKTAWPRYQTQLPVRDRFDPYSNPDNENTFYEDELGNPIIPPEPIVQPEPAMFSIVDPEFESAPRPFLSTVRSQALRRRMGLRHSIASTFQGAVRRLRRRR